MSEARDKIEGIGPIPIFPLPLVLMPFEVLPLHIFEPRYKEMLKDIELRRNIFGINLFESGSEFDKWPKEGSVGCVGEVREAQALPDGRSNILTFGLIRYRIEKYVDLGRPYLTAEVEFYEDDAEEASAVAGVAETVFGLFERVAKAAFKLSGNRGRLPDVPRAEPEQLSFLVASAFNLENDLKYKFLEWRSTGERLSKLQEILEQAAKQMEDSAEVVSAAQTNGHSKNPVDLDD